MIKIKNLLSEIHDVETLNPRDVYNLYYMWHTSLHDPQSIETPYGKEVINHFLPQLKAKYVRIFHRILANQIRKYVSRNRVDPDFPKNMNFDNASASELQTLMAKTFRSDMQRRNDVWNLIADYLVKLTYSSSVKDMFLYINQLNNAVHNTNGKVMDKLPNWASLRQAFDTVAQAKSVKAFAGMVDKDIRGLTDQAMTEEQEFDFYGTANKRIGPNTPKGHSPSPVFSDADLDDDEPSEDDTDLPVPLEESNVIQVSKADRENVAFMSGVKLAVQDKSNDVSRDLDGYSEDFIRGYKTVKRTSWWDKANNKLTQWAASLGNSYGNRR